MYLHKADGSQEGNLGVMVSNFLKHKQGNGYNKQVFEEKWKREISVENQHAEILSPDLGHILCCVGGEEKGKNHTLPS